ncbi:MAG: DUF1501 domain-containing protein [Acidobacteria bacterium]|nr:DUF1501 domain-containing protein [Acidobacteriota bacterium]
MNQRYSIWDGGRRAFLRKMSFGVGGAALHCLWGAEEEYLRPGGKPHFTPRVKSVIFLFMCGGVSAMDTFDPKDNKYAGKMLETVNSNNGKPQLRPVLHCPRVWTRYGKSGTPVCEWYPHIGGVIDDIAMVRSMYCHEVGHFPAVWEMTTGRRNRVFDFPSIGSWVGYALGSANRNLPTFVNMGRPSAPAQAGGGYLGGQESATQFQAGNTPLDNLKLPAGVTRAEREKQMEALYRLNQEFHSQHAFDAEVAARVRSYELAGTLQVAGPELVDFSKEPEHVRKLYGLNEPHTDDFGRQMLLARRLAERGVRFIQVCHGGGMGNGKWDAHDDVGDHGPLCRQTDQPIAGLIRDLKQRGMLDSTMVVWATEFGRTPYSQNNVGRDHNPHGFTCWVAGGGVKGGLVLGATDEIGHKAVENRHYVTDLQATVLKQMGLDYRKMSVVVNGRPMHMIEESAGPIEAILA